MKKPLLTIAIPTWNRANTLDKSLLHLLKRVDKFQKEIEVIISDNASEDNTPQVVNKHKFEYPAITFIYNRNNENIGFFGNFKKCRELANGKYIWVLSDDDFVCEQVVSEVIDNLQKNNEYAFIYLKNNVSLNSFRFSSCNAQEVLEKETYNIGLISAVIFFNEKTNDELLYDKYNRSPFIGFIFLLNSLNFKNKVLIIQGQCLLPANDTPKGYNFFDVFINGMNDVIDYMHYINISIKVINKFKESYLLYHILPYYLLYKAEGSLRFGMFENSTLQVIDSWIYKRYSDLFCYWILFYPITVVPAYFLNLALKIRRIFKKLFNVQ